MRKMSPKWQMQSFESVWEQMTAKLFWVLWYYITLEWTAGLEWTWSSLCHCCRAKDTVWLPARKMTHLQWISAVEDRLCTIPPVCTAWKWESAGGDEKNAAGWHSFDLRSTIFHVWNYFSSNLYYKDISFNSQTHFSWWEFIVVCFKGVSQNTIIGTRNNFHSQCGHN